MNIESNYVIIIKSIAKSLPKFWKDDSKTIELLQTYHQCLHYQIHSELVPLKSAEAEADIRELLAKYVVGYTDNKTKIVYPCIMDMIQSKIVQLCKNTDIRRENVARYTELYDDFMALASFRSYKHFCQYVEKPVFGIDLWKNNERAFTGYWFYANKMVLDGTVKFLEKQLPTGTGKSLSDAFMHAYIFGIDINNDVFKVCGNDKFTDDCFNNVIKIMTSPQYAKVFPYYAQFNGKENLMFSFCSTKELKFNITGSTVSTSLRICTKLSKTNGVRAKFLFIDDITQQDDTSTAMVTDIDKFMREWFRRNKDLNNFYVVASGTAYSQFDILSWLKNKNNFANSVQAKINEFTHIAKTSFSGLNGLAVFVIVPALDKKDESVFPTIRPTEALKQLRKDDYKTFMAMEQQDPLPPENSPFYFTKLRQYVTLPAIGETGRTDYCFAALDPKRRGKDFVSMPIFCEADDTERKDGRVFYLVDWLYCDRPMKDCVPLIVSKIVNRNIRRLYAERNTDELISPYLLEELKKLDYTGCVIEEVYSTEPKDRRIMGAEGDIKSRMIFPEIGMYASSHDVGNALNSLYGYDYNRRAVHDDAPDSLALFVKRFIGNRTMRYAEVSTFKR